MSMGEMFLEDEQPATQALEICWYWAKTENNKVVTLGYLCHRWMGVLVIISDDGKN